MSAQFSFGSSRNQSPGIVGRIFGVLFGLFFAAGGFFFLWVGTVEPLREKAQTDKWVEVPATILESEITGSGDSLENVIRFRYQYNDFVGESDEPHLNPPRLSYAEVQKLRDRLPAETETVAYVDPANPRKAVLFRNYSGFLLVGLFSLPFIGVGLAVAGFSAFGKSKAARTKGFSAGSSPSGKGKRNLLLSLFGVPFFAMGVFFCWMGGVSPLLDSREARSWPQVPCTITESFVDSHSSSDGTTYSIEIRYTYQWMGRTFHGEQYTFGDTSSSGKSSKQAVVRRYPVGSTATCFVNPDDPYEAVITTDVGLLPYGIIAFSSIFIAVGGGLIIFGLRRKKLPGPSAVTGTGEEEDFGEILELKPVTGRLTRVWGNVIFAVIWNGISCVPIIIFFNEKNGEWLLLIIGLVFGAVGLFLIFRAIRSILSLRNPVPRVLVAPGRLQPGESMNLSWRLDGSMSRLSNLTVYLEGVEVAQYRRGTRTVTDRNVFFQKCLFETSDKGSLREGNAVHDFPVASVPSMKSEHNEILWQLVFLGDIPRWPDLCESYRVPLRPVKINR